MSKTVKNPTVSNQRAGRDDKPNEQKVPTPYPPVEPIVAQRKAERKDR